MDRAARALRARIPQDPEIVVVAGSGLAALADIVDEPVIVEFTSVPGFPATGVAGHAGRYVFGWLVGRPTLLQLGRFHAYEGHATAVVAAPVRVAARLGARTLVVTNAAGGVDPDFAPGSLVLIDDHLDLTHRSPLAGPVHRGEARHPDMSRPYDAGLQQLALGAARDLGIQLRRGTYAGVLGPSYETAAEVRMLATLGADLVGMSTVAEVITARASGLRILGLSVVTNAASGVSGRDRILVHDDVLRVGERAAVQLGAILECVFLGLT